MDSVLDRIGTSDSDASEQDFQKSPAKKISLKAVMDGIEHSPVKKDADSNSDSVDHLNVKIDFGLATEEKSNFIKKMPTLIPAPTFNRNNSNESELASSEPKPLPKIVKKEKFWEYEEVDEKPKEKRKRKLPNELARLQDTDEYMEANHAIKSETSANERSKRPPRRAAMLARENVNFLHGNMENGLELRGTRKALEKVKEDLNSSRESVSSDEEKPDNSAVQNILANSDLFDAGESDEKERKPPEIIQLNLPPKPKRKKSGEGHTTTHRDPQVSPKMASRSQKESHISPRPSRELGRNLMSDMFQNQSNLSSFKIPKKTGKIPKKDDSKSSDRDQQRNSAEKSTKSRLERRERKQNGNDDRKRPRERSENVSEDRSSRLSEKNTSEKSSSDKRNRDKTERDTESRDKSDRSDKSKKKSKTEGVSDEKGSENSKVGFGNSKVDQCVLNEKVNELKRYFLEWVSTLADRKKLPN